MPVSRKEHWRSNPSMSSLMLAPPKLVKQTGLTCWAASLESWLSMKQQSPVAWHTGTETDIVKDIKEWNMSCIRGWARAY